jgi:transposase, IS5 family
MRRPVATDAGFYSAKNETTAKAKGVKRVCIPNRFTKAPECKREQKKRWFRLPMRHQRAGSSR